MVGKMKTKEEISQEYFEIIDNINQKIEDYESLLNDKYLGITNLSNGNRGIQEIEEELTNMKQTVQRIKEMNMTMKNQISSNQNLF